ncbi:MAG: CocE/NonD family hydrolase [Acidobacteriaceae bacterium]
MIDCGSGVRLERSLHCAMSDGVVLVSDHYYPPKPGPHPTILMRQPYGRDIASTVVYAHPVWFASHGYNVVIQDVRGRGDSEGEFYPFRSEGRDGAETIQWLRSRGECDGRIGMYGFSYQGLTQLLAAAEQPEGLVCIAPAQTACDLYHGWFYRQGALRLASSLGWGLQMLKADARRRKLREASDALEKAWTDLRSQPLVTPYGLHPQIQQEGMPVYVHDWLTHNLPGPYWSELDVSESLSRITIPALHISGWFDTYLSGSIAGFLAMSKHAHHQYLLAGPWIHIPWGDSAGEQNLGPEALLDTDSLLLRWFNHWFKNTGDFARQPRIRHFALGANRWCDADSFPEDYLSFFLHSGGRAESRKGDGALSRQAPDSPEPRDIFVYDPEVPVLAPGGAAALSGPINQAQVELGNNLLVYTTPALTEPLHVFGSPRLTLHAVTSAAYADFTAKLVRARPGGQADFVCIGIARSSYLFRDSGYGADKVHRWEIELEPTSFLFAAGDAIRLEIAGSAFPLYDRNPSTSVEPWLMDSWNWQRSTHMVLHDESHRSRLDLPLAAAR